MGLGQLHRVPGLVDDKFVVGDSLACVNSWILSVLYCKDAVGFIGTQA